MPILEKIKRVYILWHEYHATIPKTHRYTLGSKVDALFVEVMESVSAAAFLPRDKKMPYVQVAIRKVDTLKLLLMILWETKSLDTKKYTVLAEMIYEVGKMLGGWNGQLAKNSAPPKRGEK